MIDGLVNSITFFFGGGGGRKPPSFFMWWKLERRTNTHNIHWKMQVYRLDSQ